MPLVRSNPFLVLNGDSFCEIDPERLLRFHTRKRLAATIAVTTMKAAKTPAQWRWNDRVMSMVEKPRTRTANYHNAGVYLFDRAVTTLFRTCRSGLWSGTCCASRRISVTDSSPPVRCTTSGRTSGPFP